MTEEFPDDEGSNDSLAGKRVTIGIVATHKVTPPEVVPIYPSTTLVGDELLIRTTAIELKDDGVTDVVVSLSNSPDATGEQYGIRVEEYGPEGWFPLLPDSTDETWLWTRVAITYQNGELLLDGDSVRYTDSFSGLSYNVEERSSTLITGDRSEMPRLRFLAYPTWDFWDWDATGYGIEVNLDRTTCSYNGDEYPQDSIVGPYECHDGRWTHAD
jgi:hypothetical protein